MERSANHILSLYGRDGRRKYVTPSERMAFIALALVEPNALVGTLCLILAYTGCRISEALRLIAARIEQQECFVAFITLKKRGRLVVREVPIPAELVARIEQHHRLSEVGPDARLFPWSRGRAWVLVKDVLLRSGCAPGPHCTCKGLRHGFGIHAIRSGVPLNLVSRWLGHSNIATTAIYLDATGDEEREIASRMWQATSTDASQKNCVPPF